MNLKPQEIWAVIESHAKQLAPDHRVFTEEHRGGAAMKQRAIEIGERIQQLAKELP